MSSPPAASVSRAYVARVFFSDPVLRAARTAAVPDATFMPAFHDKYAALAADAGIVEGVTPAPDVREFFRAFFPPPSPSSAGNTGASPSPSPSPSSTGNTSADMTDVGEGEGEGGECYHPPIPISVPVSSTASPSSSSAAAARKAAAASLKTAHPSIMDSSSLTARQRTELLDEVVLAMDRMGIASPNDSAIAAALAAASERPALTPAESRALYAPPSADTLSPLIAAAIPPYSNVHPMIVAATSTATRRRAFVAEFASRWAVLAAAAVPRVLPVAEAFEAIADDAAIDVVLTFSTPVTVATAAAAGSSSSPVAKIDPPGETLATHGKTRILAAYAAAILDAVAAMTPAKRDMLAAAREAGPIVEALSSVYEAQVLYECVFRVAHNGASPKHAADYPAAVPLTAIIVNVTATAPPPSSQ